MGTFPILIENPGQEKNKGRITLLLVRENRR
jgi:hypothetical protein